MHWISGLSGSQDARDLEMHWISGSTRHWISGFTGSRDALDLVIHWILRCTGYRDALDTVSRDSLYLGIHWISAPTSGMSSIRLLLPNLVLVNFWSDLVYISPDAVHVSYLQLQVMVMYHILALSTSELISLSDSRINKHHPGMIYYTAT